MSETRSIRKLRLGVGALQRSHACLTGLPDGHNRRAIRQGGAPPMTCHGDAPSWRTMADSAATLPAARALRGEGLWAAAGDR